MIKGRGRNGWFAVHAAEVYYSPKSPLFETDTITINLYSRQRGDTAPVIFRGSPEEVKTLFASIVSGVNMVDRNNSPTVEIEMKGGFYGRSK